MMMMNFCLLARACVLLTFVGKKKVVGSGVVCVFQKALSAFGYSFMCNGIAAKFDKGCEHVCSINYVSYVSNQLLEVQSTPHIIYSSFP